MREKSAFRRYLLAAAVFLLPGCDGLSSEAKWAIGLAAGATAVGGAAPTSDIQQTYYIGIFDPQEQLPPQMYRIRLHGQSSFISTTNFASGWVPAPLVDSLSSGISIDPNGGAPTIGQTKADQLAEIVSGRKLIMFGPEGFREAPKDHRLVVVMGSSPENYFKAIDETLGITAEALDRKKGTKLQGELFQELLFLRQEQARLNDVNADLRLTQDRAQRGDQ